VPFIANLIAIETQTQHVDSNNTCTLVIKDVQTLYWTKQ